MNIVEAASLRFVTVIASMLTEEICRQTELRDLRLRLIADRRASESPRIWSL
jgi:hypothetical protein